MIPTWNSQAHFPRNQVHLARDFTCKVHVTNLLFVNYAKMMTKICFLFFHSFTITTRLVHSPNSNETHNKPSKELASGGGWTTKTSLGRKSNEDAMKKARLGPVGTALCSDHIGRRSTPYDRWAVWTLWDREGYHYIIESCYDNLLRGGHHMEDANWMETQYEWDWVKRGTFIWEFKKSQKVWTQWSNCMIQLWIRNTWLVIEKLN